jgi:hypothetical protein
MLLARLPALLYGSNPAVPARTGNKTTEPDFVNVKGIDSWAPGTQMETGITYTVKKLFEIPVPSRDVTYQTLPGQE